MLKTVINKELADRRTAICFNCGALFTADHNDDSNCPECGDYWNTRWITTARTWLHPVKMGLLTEDKETA